MQKPVSAVLTAFALALAFTLTASTQERHPEIHAAKQHLREAKRNLEHAAHDFGGHRAAALKHVDEALAECDQALAFDKK